MSRVIKAAVWKEKPHLIDTPEPPQAQTLPDVKLDDESLNNMMAEIAAKEQRASDMLNDAKINAEIIKQEANAEHDKIIEAAKAEAAELKEKAQQEGRLEGFKAGHAEGEQKIREEMQNDLLAANAKAEKTLADAKNAMRDYVQQAENDVITIVMSVVEKILPQHFIDVPQVVLPLVQKAIAKVKDQKEIVIRVSPASYDMVLMARDEFRNILTYGDATIEIKSDESMQPGDCLLETPDGSVDARLATQIELIKQAVQGVMI